MIQHKERETLPLVSIIIVNWNGKKWLKDCFESLEKLDYPKDKYEVIMGDNASTDDSVDYAKENFPRVKILQFDKNYGFCKANNLCAKEAKGEYVVFLNNDTIVDTLWLKILVEGALSKKDVISCVGKMLKPYTIDGQNVIDYAGGRLFVGGGEYVGIYDTDKKEYNVPKYTGFGCGAGVLVQKKFFLKIGGFSEIYFAGTEEAELGLRIWQYGYRVLYVPSAIMIHIRVGTFGSVESPMIVFVNIRNPLYFILKNFEIRNVVLGLFYHLFISSASRFFISFLLGKFYVCSNIIKAYIFFIKNIKDLEYVFQERRKIQKNRLLSDDELYKIGVISPFSEKLKASFKAFKITFLDHIPKQERDRMQK